MRIGLMGGSFNPVHLGHLHLAQAALDSGSVDRVLFLPSGNPPHKRAGLADKMDRLAMVQLAVEGRRGMGVCREEIDREGVIYTVDTLSLLRMKQPQDTLVYLIGADTLRTLSSWRRPEDVVRLCELLVLAREGEEDMQRYAEHWRGKGAVISFLRAQTMDVSSTKVRALAAAGQPLGALVPQAVEAYIRSHGLYQESWGEQ
ncbi:MAG: nicotinate-nucleotide adenylyltransferase [Clostridia bacterium]|nr:nicotinate-nucleotide adenylyltransferase [Clostridia bacterium]